MHAYLMTGFVQRGQLRPVISRGRTYQDYQSWGSCDTLIVLGETLEEARNHAWQGECVAVQLGVPRSQGDLEPPRMTLGFIGGGYQEQPRGKDRR